MLAPWMLRFGAVWVVILYFQPIASEADTTKTAASVGSESLQTSFADIRLLESLDRAIGSGEEFKGPFEVPADHTCEIYFDRCCKAHTGGAILWTREGVSVTARFVVQEEAATAAGEPSGLPASPLERWRRARGLAAVPRQVRTWVLGLRVQAVRVHGCEGA